MSKTKTKKTAAKKPVAVKKEAKAKFGSDIVIGKIGENPRRQGTGCYRRFEAMSKYVSSNKRATLADVIANTDYTSTDYAWDKARGFIG